ncbi:hippurate hydrolase [Roseobacter sp. MED193]|jgi:hippurate hydrolase|uniref:M20 metallopeptidase family protein n=1 Tax=Rhodobacterales TaxID=204455 RepID=UPI000068A03D|nr:amidohydrolase [Roseobacter sp. MED193]EAQ43909.1 hippurate hydrolase [Roseobacter sp. MED193]
MFTTWYETQSRTSQNWLQTLHRHPETGFEVARTAAFVADRLSELGYTVVTGIAGTGVVGTLHGQDASPESPGRCIAFRAELDGLPMQEKAKVDYASEDPSRFHGCGHDGHMVTALTAAAYLAEHRQFDGTVRFIFQPAEELLTGARAMIADGLFDRFPCDEIYALHNSPDLPAGQVGIPTTAALSSADNIDVTIRANGAHGSMPHTGEDAILAAAQLITSVQQATTRLVDAREAGVISFGLFQGGTARNILPEAVRLEGTMRTTSSTVRDRLADLLQDAVRATELLFGVLIEIDVEKVAPVTLNDPTCVSAAVSSATRVVGVERVVENARNLMASEDFSELSSIVPGAYFFIGQGGYAPHHPEFVFDPDIIPVGAAIFADLAKLRTSKTLNSHKLT